MLIVLKGPDGIRRVPEGVPYRKLPGEKVIGSETDAVEGELIGVLDDHGIKMGDFIKAAINLVPESIRPKHCSKCEERRLVLNKVKELGVAETFRKLREIK